MAGARVDRNVDVAVGADEAVAGEVLAAVAHPRLQQAEDEALRKDGNDARVTMERAVADDVAAAVVEVEHRREAEVDSARAQLGAEHVTGGTRRLDRAHCAAAARAVRIVHPHLAEGAHRCDRSEAVAAEALDAAAFVVEQEAAR